MGPKRKSKLKMCSASGLKLLGMFVLFNIIPQAKAVKCDTPEEVENGRASFPSELDYDSIVTYHCNQGFSLIGNTSRRCNEKGVWSDSAPACKAVCKEKTIQNANSNDGYEREFFVLGNQLQFTCKTGFADRKLAMLSTTCTLYENKADWFPLLNIFKCEELCPLFPTNNYQDTRIEYVLGFPTGKRFFLNDYVEFKCAEGYRDISKIDSDAFKVHCLPTSYWDPSPVWKQKTFSCRRYCGHPGTPGHGQTIGSSYIEGATLTFKCDLGFHINGERQVNTRCLNNGTWSVPRVDCQEVNCGRPEITNGICSGQYPSHFAYGKSVSCQCNTGYELTTSNNAIRCQENGRWTYLHCKAVKCDTPEEVENGRVSFPSELDYDSIVTYHCNQGFSLIGNTIRRCNEKGVWSDSAPACKELKSTKDVLQKLSTEEKKCKKITLSGNLKIDANVGSRVHFYCDEGYTLFGSNEIECLPTIEWSIDKAPICKPVVCDQLDIQNGSFNVSLPVQFNTFIGYSCNENYILVGNQTIECLRTGKLSSEKPYCKTITCDSPAEGPHLIISFPSRLEFGSEITYTCENEMTLNGPSTRTCQANGTWSGKDPVCVFNCPPPSEPWQGYWIGNDYSLGSSITLKCNKGYMVAGADKQTCREDQTWYPSQSPTCQRTCEQPIDPFGRLSDQHKSKNVFTQGDVVRIICSNQQRHEGYNLQCYDGQWAPPGSPGAFTWNTCGGFCLRPPSQVKATLSPRFTYKNMYNVDDYLYFDCDSIYSRRRGYYLYCRQDHTKQTNWENDCGRGPCCS
ncbi:sushi, von Willebrand factor type A, EGF and pentraxin domain-containing protein 1-like [Lethenteron reissneri]|uniref:sushi, von Willebrand factor type A, EGF and pentraxin domain-containing protein 1-like n=1 Tax=Lethenteron reissneri TaxID=7753 RepID=UPI002AB73F91|nr:sushi, von Willebrand factor type A, EGF and pentraxin domain-containing protein 1-like [Lethenteron reissneri]